MSFLHRESTNEKWPPEESTIEKKWPVLTVVLIGICISVFIVQALVPYSTWRDFMFVPLLASSRPWTFVSSIFLHANFNHLMFNLFGLALFGYCVETSAGRTDFMITFFLAGILSKFGTILTIPVYGASLGASGAIMGVIGFLAIVDPLRRVWFFTFFPHPVIFWVFVFAVSNFMGLFNPAGPIGYGAHLCGLTVGILLGIYRRTSGV